MLETVLLIVLLVLVSPFAVILGWILGAKVRGQEIRGHLVIFHRTIWKND